MKINIKIKNLAKKINQEFPDSEIFLVGGGVRDLLLTKSCKDYDLLVRGVPARKLEKFLKTLGKVNLVGKNFGIFKFQITNIKYQIDIALPRTEYSLGKTGAYRDFKIQTNYKLKIEDDLSRRDFTVNAIAYNILKNKIIDPFAGQQDLKKKLIRAVGKPEERLKEDYSRMLRAIRFTCQLNFPAKGGSSSAWKIEAKTWMAVKKLSKNINKKSDDDFVVPRETIAKELLKAFYHKPLKALELFDQAGLIKHLMPELLKMKKCPQPPNWHTEGDVWQHTVLCLKNLDSTKYKRKFPDQPSINLIMALLFHDLGKPYTIQTPKQDGTDRIRFNDHDQVGAKKTKEICSRLKLSAHKDENIDCDCDDLAWLVRSHMLTVHGKIDQIKNTTLEKYFFSDKPGADLLQLIFIDAISTIPRQGEIYVNHYNQLNKRLQALSRLQKTPKKILPKLLIDGNEIMKLLKIKPGPRVGQVMELLREEQLKKKIKTKKQAREFVKRIKL